MTTVDDKKLFNPHELMEIYQFTKKFEDYNTTRNKIARLLLETWVAHNNQGVEVEIESTRDPFQAKITKSTIDQAHDNTFQAEWRSFIMFSNVTDSSLQSIIALFPEAIFDITASNFDSSQQSDILRRWWKLQEEKRY